ncbi:hypothetical protein [Pseudomonas fluorescens]|jgi:hypothetical protein|uniref:hypothetical protein n=1 Tax=Pseudomonas fluorescens TaxID=294 RepID=UPI0027876843|nr:hypothetical protein [Pseudomonas fluorescens]MDP9783045.1 hypothetical protein [Pseudomonas fluorescens]
MDIKRWFHLVVLLFAFALQSTNADTTVAASEVKVTAVAAQAQGATPAAPVTIQIRNNTTVPIKVQEGEGPPPEILEPKENFGSQRFPGYELSVHIPENNKISLIRVFGQGDECRYPICIMVY